MKIKIGITVDFTKGVWSSGINQNAIYLAEVLLKADYDVRLIHDSAKVAGEYDRYIKKFNPIGNVEAVKQYFDLIIGLGLRLDQSHVNALKLINPNFKLVAYKCGNEFFSDAENILFSAHESRESYYKGGFPIPDQIWSIPQMEETNLFYYSYTHSQEKATVVPFVWNPTAIEYGLKNEGHTEYAQEEISDIAVMEPNISCFKNLLFPLVAVDKYYRFEGRGKINSVMMIGAERLAKKSLLFDLVSKSQMFEDKIISFDSRVKTQTVLNKYCNLVFSWQMYNPLNYLYLDVAWLGYPIVHNGHLCKDIGYFYNNFNMDEAVDKLSLAVNSHQTDIEYMSRNRKAIFRFTSNNPKLIEQYRELIEDVINDRFKKRTYNWETNSIS